MPVVVDPKVLSPMDFIKAVLELRLPNPFMPDTPQRIACDTSQKLPIRFGETIKAYIAREDLDVNSLTLIPMVFAGWCRYLTGIDDEGNAFDRSPDPLLDEVSAMSTEELLKREDIFGVDLYKVGLATKVLDIYNEMQGVGAVRKTLNKYVDK